MATPTELRFAVFGESGCGKTTLLASYYGTQSGGDWEKRHGYRLLVEDPARSEALYTDYLRLKGCSFPRSTKIFTETVFQFRLQDLPAPVLNISWYDYPGEWWIQEPSEAQERATRNEAIRTLLSCQIGFLVFDGARFMADGAAYAVKVVKQFCNNVRRHRLALEEMGLPFAAYPRHWAFVLSKADLFPDDYAAGDFEASLATSIEADLEDLRREFAGATGIGTRFLLLSSVKAPEGTIVDPRSSLGLNLVAPVAFLGALRQIEGVPFVYIRLLEILASAVDQLPIILDVIDVLLPASPKGRVIAAFRKGIGWLRRGGGRSGDDARITEVVEKLVNRLGELDPEKISEWLRGRASDLARKGDALGAACLAMSTELSSPSARRLVRIAAPPSPPAEEPRPDLVELFGTWDTLSEATKAKILRLARGDAHA